MAKRLSPDSTLAYELSACVDMAYFSEYRAALDIANEQVKAGLMEESALAELKAMSLDVARVRNRSLTYKPDRLLGALELALTDEREWVASELLYAIKGIVPAGRASGVPDVLLGALNYRADSQVQFGAAEVLAYMNPTSGLSATDSQAVTENLTIGLTQAGRRVAISVLPEEDQRLNFDSKLRKTNFQAFNERNPVLAVSQIIKYPHDVIIVSDELGPDFSTAKLIKEVRRDDRTKKTPIIVVTEDDKVELVKTAYAATENVTVVGNGIGFERLRNDVLEPITQSDSGPRARGAQIALRAAKAIHFLATRDNGFPIGSLTSAVEEALDTRPEEDVRIECCQILAAIGNDSSKPPIMRALSEETISSELKIAAFSALGSVLRGSGEVESDVDQAIQQAIMDENIQVAEAAAQARGMIGIRPAISSGK